MSEKTRVPMYATPIEMIEFPDLYNKDTKKFEQQTPIFEGGTLISKKLVIKLTIPNPFKSMVKDMPFVDVKTSWSSTDLQRIGIGMRTNITPLMELEIWTQSNNVKLKNFELVKVGDKLPFDESRVNDASGILDKNGEKVKPKSFFWAENCSGVLSGQIGGQIGANYLITSTPQSETASKVAETA